MLTTYFLTAFSSVLRQPVFFAVKILGLAIGLVCSMLVLLHVQYATSSNKHIQSWERTYRLVSHFTQRESQIAYRSRVTADPVGPMLNLEYPSDIEYLARTLVSTTTLSNANMAIEDDVYLVDPDVIQIFDLTFIQGDPSTALNQPNSIVLTQESAKKYFGLANPMGETLTINDDTDVRVTGIIANYPENATHDMELIVPASLGTVMYGSNFMNSSQWLSFYGTETFVVLREGVRLEDFNDRLPIFIQRRMPDASKQLASDISFSLSLQSIADIYLNPLENFGSPENPVAKRVLTGLSVFAILVFITSSVNYVNLMQSQLSHRKKEIGIRKTLGAKRADILSQFVLESLIIAIIALAVAMPVLVLLMPVYSANTFISLTTGDLFQLNTIGLFSILTLFVGMVAGFFPALAISKTQPAENVKNANGQGRADKLYRGITSVVQFGVSTALLLFALAVYAQIHYLQEYDIGFSNEDLVVLDTRFDSTGPDSFSYEAMLDRIEQHSGVLSVSASNFFPTGGTRLSQWKNSSVPSDETFSVRWGVVSASFNDTYGLEMLAGRFFSEEFSTDFVAQEVVSEDQVYGIVVTDILASRLGFGEPSDAVDAILTTDSAKYRIIGVVRRFQFSSGMETDQESIGILAASLTPKRFVSVKLDPLQSNQALDHLDKIWGLHRPEVPLDKTFLSQSMSAAIDRRNGGLAVASVMATIITAAIAAFGLYSLATFASVKRSKEIGVRKVLGASVFSLTFLLVWDFVKLVLLGVLLAWPVAYFGIDFYYSGFPGHANFPIEIFAIAPIGLIVLAVLTVTTKCLKLARLDPVKTLRYE